MKDQVEKAIAFANEAAGRLARLGDIEGAASAIAPVFVIRLLQAEIERLTPKTEEPAAEEPRS